jgi:hypothetical protein
MTRNISKSLDSNVSCYCYCYCFFSCVWHFFYWKDLFCINSPSKTWLFPMLLPNRTENNDLIRMSHLIEKDSPKYQGTKFRSFHFHLINGK